MYTMYTDYSFPREGVGQQDVYNVYRLQFSTRGVGQQDVYNVYRLQFFFWSVSYKSEGESARGRVNIIYIFIIYIII